MARIANAGEQQRFATLGREIAEKVRALALEVGAIEETSSREKVAHAVGKFLVQSVFKGGEQDGIAWLDQPEFTEGVGIGFGELMAQHPMLSAGIPLALLSGVQLGKERAEAVFTPKGCA